MAWDDDKQTADSPANPQPNEQLSADEWDNHVSEGHFPSDELNFSIDGNGDPVITDPQNADEVVMRYDRSAGAWVVDSISTEELWNNITAVSMYATGGSGTFNDPYTSPTGTGGIEEARQAIPDEGGMIVWDGFSLFENQWTVPETQYSMTVTGHHQAGAKIDSGFPDSNAILVKISGESTLTQNPNKIGGMHHVFDGFTMFGNKDNVAGDVTAFKDSSVNDRIAVSWINDLQISEFTNRGVDFFGNIWRVNSCDITYCDGIGIKFRRGDIRALDTTVNTCGQTKGVPGVVLDGKDEKFYLGEVTLCGEDSASGVQVEFTDTARGCQVLGAKLAARPSQSQLKPYVDNSTNINRVRSCYADANERLLNTDELGELTKGVSTAGTIIYTAPTNRSNAMLFISGVEQGSTQNSFVDAILQIRGAELTRFAQDTAGAPTRTYSLSGQSLNLAMGSGTWDVRVQETLAFEPGV